MPENSNTEIISKITKLLNLAEKSSNEGESHNAAAMAQKLMMKYSIEMGDVDAGREASKETADDEVIDSSKSLIWYKKLMCMVIAKNFRVKTYLERDHTTRQTAIKFIGLSTDINIAKKVYNFAIEELEWHTRNYMKSHSGCEIKNSYIRGYIEGLKEYFNSQVKTNQWDMIIIPGDAVMEQYNKKHLVKKSMSSGRSTNSHEGNCARNAGIRDGKNFNTTKKIGDNN